MKTLGISVSFLLAAISAAHAEPISICAKNRTAFGAQIQVRALTAEGEVGARLFTFRVESGTVECRDWSEPLSEFGVSALLLNTPVGTRSLRDGQWVCFQDSAETVMDGLVWALIYDHRSHGYEFGCANTHNGAETVAIFDPDPPGL